MDNGSRRINHNVAEIGRMRSRPMGRRGWLALLLIFVVLAGAAAGAAWGVAALFGAGGAAVEYNAGTAPTQDRIAAWLGGPDSAERERLRSWLAGRGFEGSETLWLVSAPQEELDAAVADLVGRGSDGACGDGR